MPGVRRRLPKSYEDAVKLFDGVVFIHTSNGRIDCDVVFTHGHVEKADFADAIAGELGRVQHVWGRYKDAAGEKISGFTGSERSDEFPEPITLAHV